MSADNITEAFREEVCSHLRASGTTQEQATEATKGLDLRYVNGQAFAISPEGGFKATDAKDIARALRAKIYTSSDAAAAGKAQGAKEKAARNAPTNAFT